MSGFAHLLLNDESDALAAQYVALFMYIVVVLIMAVRTLSNAINAVASSISAALNSEG